MFFGSDAGEGEGFKARVDVVEQVGDEMRGCVGRSGGRGSVDQPGCVGYRDSRAETTTRNRRRNCDHLEEYCSLLGDI